MTDFGVACCGIALRRDIAQVPGLPAAPVAVLQLDDGTRATCTGLALHASAARERRDYLVMTLVIEIRARGHEIVAAVE